MPRAIVIRAAGTNCDAELCRAFAGAGAEVDLIHVNALVQAPDELDRYDIIGFPGGFSYGDDIASGRLFAQRVRLHLLPPLRRAAERGCPILGVCNGFQVLVQVGLLPGPTVSGPDRHDGLSQEATLTVNRTGGFIDEWIGMSVEADSQCIWTRGLGDAPEDPRTGHLQLPVAHGEGRFQASDEVLDRLEANGQIPLRYVDNVNGSSRAVAGICDVTGRIFGLMPHPERFLEWIHHPYWTRLSVDQRSGETPAARLFRNAVEAAAELPA